MRIAYVSADQGVPVFGRKGCSIHVQEVVRAFVRLGAHVELFTPRPEGAAPAGLESVTVHPLPRPATANPARRERESRAANAELAQALARAGPIDLVYERYSLWSHAGMEYARDADVPGVLEVNAPLIEEQAEHRTLVDRRGAEAAARRAFAAAGVLAVVSQEVAAYLAGWPEAAGRIHVVPNGVDPERFTPPPGRPSTAAFTVGFVGSLKPWHGLETLTEAFARHQSRHPRSRLLVVGDGPGRAGLEEAVAHRGLTSAAHFTGAVPPEGVPALLAEMDAGVAPYPRLRSFYFSPLKVYEYMAAGLGVVASRSGQLEALIEHGVNGLHFAPGDAAALAAALDELAADPGLRRRLGQAARATILRGHTWDGVAQRLVRLAFPVDAAVAVGGGVP
jgi:glycosyltransferase involved in cell wall biosynthesis